MKKNLSQLQPVRLQRKRVKGFKLESPNGLPIIYVGRPTKYGNPFSIEEYGREKALDLFEFNLRANETLYNQALELKGKNLACFCSLSEKCHADVLLEIANS